MMLAKFRPREDVASVANEYEGAVDPSVSRCKVLHVRFNPFVVFKSDADL